MVAQPPSGIEPLTHRRTSPTATGQIVVVLAVVYFASVITFVCRDNVERAPEGRAVCAMLFVGAALFWSGFEQAGSSMNLFAKRLPPTGRFLRYSRSPPATLQSVNPLFIILMAPVIGMLWVWLGARSPSIPVKFGMGLAAARLPGSWCSPGARPTCRTRARSGCSGWSRPTSCTRSGELCLSPVGLSSSVTKLAPDRLVGQMMGTWFMGAALGNLVAGLVTQFICETMPQSQLYGTVATIVIVGSGLVVVILVLAKPMNWLAAGVK